MSDQSNKLAKGTIYLTISVFIFVITGYAVNVWLGRELHPIAYGLFGLATSIMTIANTLQTSGLPQATSKFVSQRVENSDQILRSSMVIQMVGSLLLAIILAALAVPIAHLLNDQQLVPCLLLVALIFPSYGLFSLYMGFYNGLHNFGKQSLINIVYSVAKMILIIGLALKFGIYGALVGFILAPIFGIAVGFRLPKVNLQTANFPYKELLLFSVPLVIYSFVSTLQISADVFFVKALRPNSALVGFYTASQNIGRIPYYVLAGLSMVVFPAIARQLGLGRTVHAKNIAQSALRYLIILLFPMTAILMATSSELIKLVYGQSYLQASLALQYLLPGYAAITVFSLLANVLNASGKTRLSWIYSLLGICLSALIFPWLISVFGLPGAAIGTGIGALLSAILSIRAVRRYLPITLPLKTTLNVVVSTVVVYLLAELIRVNGLILVPWYLTLALTYVLLLLLLKETTTDDKQQIKHMLPTKFKRFFPV